MITLLSITRKSKLEIIYFSKKEAKPIQYTVKVKNQER